MKKQKHSLTDIWDNYPAVYSDKNYSSGAHQEIMKRVAEILTPGPFYYYTITYPDNSLQNFSESILQIHGLKEYPTSLHNIIELIHPDDIAFVLDAEDIVLKKIQEIGVRHLSKMENSYCFRMRIADGSYHLFHHKAVILNLDSEGKLTTSLNIHTDIHHITQQNNHVILVNKRNDKKDCYRIAWNNIAEHPDSHSFHLTRRETEILHLISKGLSSQAIADKLFISVQTVRMHRKNMLKKTQTTNSVTLIRKSIELGWI